MIVPANETTSMPYAQAKPSVPTTTPPSAGPTIWAVFHITWFRASADGSRSGGTRLGVIAERVASEKPEKPATSPAPT